MGTDKTDNLTCEIVYDNFTRENYYLFKQSSYHSLWIFHIIKKTVVYLVKDKYMGAWKYHICFSS